MTITEINQIIALEKEIVRLRTINAGLIKAFEQALLDGGIGRIGSIGGIIGGGISCRHQKAIND